MAKTWPYYWITAGGFFFFLAAWKTQVDGHLGFSSLATGWVLFGILILLSLFNIRKKISVLPLARNSAWWHLHTAGGFLALGAYWLHTGTFWPHGLYEQVLAFLFYAVSLTGIVGMAIQMIFPARLTQTGMEFIFERIPGEISGLRQEAKELLLACTRETGRDTLATHYLESLHWFFQRPRFVMKNIFSGRIERDWVRQQFFDLERYLNLEERGYLRKLFTLAETKRKIDFHYSLQTVLKTWLLIHLPLAASTLALVTWHLVVVHVYLL
ncbi:MAG: hypothetical protein ACE5E9_06265 [Nitrospinaceae bacterium]